MSKIFLSYRRDDSAADTGRIHEHLVGVFSKDEVFRDVDSIRTGIDFREALDQALARCDFVLVIIGKRWLNAADESGRRRLDDPGDFVRLEIETALKRGIPVIPVVVSNAGMPKASDLPDTLRNLAYRNGLPVRPDPDFLNDMKRLIDELTRPRAPVARPLAWVGAALLAAATGALLVRRPSLPAWMQPADSGAPTETASTPRRPPPPEQTAAVVAQTRAPRRSPPRRLTADLDWLAGLGAGQANGGLEVSIEANHPSGAYREGEPMRFTVRTNQDAYLYILHADADGKVQMLFPNPHDRENAVRAGTDTLIPPLDRPEDETFDLVASPPYGPELIKAIASPSRLQLDGFRAGSGSLGKPAALSLPSTRGRLTRGIRLVAPKRRSVDATARQAAGAGVLAVADCPVVVEEPR